VRDSFALVCCDFTLVASYPGWVPAPEFRDAVGPPSLPLPLSPGVAACFPWRCVLLVLRVRSTKPYLPLPRRRQRLSSAAVSGGTSPSSSSTSSYASSPRSPLSRGRRLVGVQPAAASTSPLVLVLPNPGRRRPDVARCRGWRPPSGACLFCAPAIWLSYSHPLLYASQDRTGDEQIDAVERGKFGDRDDYWRGSARYMSFSEVLVCFLLVLFSLLQGRT
jgi:hypothetical protein